MSIIAISDPWAFVFEQKYFQLYFVLQTISYCDSSFHTEIATVLFYI